MDDIEVALVTALVEDARVGVLELSRRLGVARATVQARMDRLVARGVLSFRVGLDPAAMGYEVLAFVSLEIRQRRDAEALEHLHTVPEVLEVVTSTGTGDLLCRVVARSNADLQQVIDRIVQSDAILRTDSQIALSTRLPYRVDQLVEHAE